MVLCMCRLSRLSVMVLNGVSVRQCVYGVAKACEGVRVGLRDIQSCLHTPTPGYCGPKLCVPCSYVSALYRE